MTALANPAPAIPAPLRKARRLFALLTTSCRFMGNSRNDSVSVRGKLQKQRGLRARSLYDLFRRTARLQLARSYIAIRRAGWFLRASVSIVHTTGQTLIQWQ